MINIFSKNSIGIDIADTTIEIAELKGGGKGMKISGLGRIGLDLDIVERGRIKDKGKLSQAVKKVLAKAKPNSITDKRIIFGLPESQVYTHIFKLGSHDKKERDDLVLEEVYKNIPLSKENILFSYKELRKTEQGLEFLLIAASREVVLEWQQFFQELGLRVEFFDVEILAIFRGLFIELPQAPVCLIDIGAKTTNLAIFDQQGLHYSYLIDIAGNTFTQEIAKALAIKPEEAEKKKIEMGLASKNGKVFSILTKFLGTLNEEIKTSIDYFQEKTGQKVKEIILVGGSSQLKGINEYFSTNLELPVKIGQSVLISKNVPLEYIGAVGLALRGIDKKWSRDPVLEPLLEEESTKILISKQDPTEKIVQRPSNGVVSDIKKPVELNDFRPRSRTKLNLNSKKLLLIIILIVGVVLIGTAYWYSNFKKSQREEKAQTQLEELDKKLDEQSEIEDPEEIIVPMQDRDPDSEDVGKTKEMILIQETGIGYLNVREGAGTNYDILTKVYPGESYPLLEETEEWVKIELGNGREGWVFKIYIKK